MSDNLRPLRAALYIRVSTDKQTTENQTAALTTEAARRNWAIVATYEDAGISGAKSREKRPGLDNMLKDATRGKFDILMVWAVDRLGRSLIDLIHTMQDLDGAKVNLFLHQQAIDTTTPFGRAMFQMLGVFAEFERSMITTRIHAGLERRRSQGKAMGRPVLGREKNPQARAEKREKLSRAETLLQEGATIYRVVKETGLGSGTVQKMAREILSRRQSVELE